MASLRRCSSDPSSMDQHGAPNGICRQETDPMIEMEEQSIPEKPKKKRLKNPSTLSTISAGVLSVESNTYSDVHEAYSDVHEAYPSVGERTKCFGSSGCGRGIVEDYKRTIKIHWKEEMTNLSLKTIAVGFFLFFACISPAITFGAIYAKATSNWIGAVEMIAATAWCGIAYALIGAQPMMINGGTGPVLAFAEILYSMSVGIGVPFLTFNAWVGLWVFVYMVISAFVNLNRILAYCTKFTDEIFSFLISTIFIINAIGSPFAPIGVVYYFFPDHKSHQAHADDPNYDYLTVAIFSLMICIGTVQVSFLLRNVKFSPFLCNQMSRNVITDFAVVSSIVLWTVIASVSGIQTETLNVPDTFAPTYACCTDSCDSNWPTDCPDLSEPARRRPWLVDLGDLNGNTWVPFMAAGPALLAFVLVFLDDGITWHLINAPAHKLTHGSAFNYDTIIIGIMIAINSMLGFPWLVAATVRSLNHLHALAEKTPSGKIISVTETRLTGLFIHLLCLASVFALNVLKLIPVPVLYGVFLFMGIVSLGTNTFWTRITMFFMQPSRYPLEPFTVHVKPRRMHLYTIIQLTLFALLYVVKAIKAIAIAFPIIIALCIPIRLYVLPRIFTEKELVMIDSDDAHIKEWLSKHPDEMTTEEAAGEHAVLIPVDDEKDIDDGDEGVPPVDKVVATPPVDAEDNGHDEERADEPTPLPDIASVRRERRKARRKTVSCPPHMLFAEVELPPTAPDAGVASMIEKQEAGETAQQARVRKKRSKRTKSLSCPTHMLFAEVPLAATEVGISTIIEEPDEEEEKDEELASPHLRQRKKRTKSLSCPPHMLFREAERQVSSNYFFG